MNWLERLPLSALFSVSFSLLGVATGSIAAPASVEQGRDIYLRGMLPSGDPVRAHRPGLGEVSGREAACVNCHGRSGLGSAEGRTVMPPITGSYLFRPRATNIEHLDLRHASGYSASLEPYNDATLAAAITTGASRTGGAGSILSPVMPRYAMSAADVAALTGYLKQLSSEPSPGVSADTLHFATIIAPGVPAAQRAAYVQVLERFFRDKNAGTRHEVRRSAAAAEVMFKTYRRWALQVWELEGHPQSWQDQLDRQYARAPVFAVIGGISTGTWEPVHAFCRTQAVPCVFPSVDAPAAMDADFYSLYFSKGVVLEAEVMARHLRERQAAGSLPQRIVQVRRDDVVATLAARTLVHALAGSGLDFDERVIASGQQVRTSLDGLTASDLVVLWLREDDTARLEVPPAVSSIYLSGTLTGDASAAMPAVLRERARLIYPFSPPAERARSLQLQAWLRAKGIPLIDERIQGQALFAASAVSEAAGHLLDNFLRDYLVERLEMMVGKMRFTAMYPRLGIGSGQRFGSKGAYVAGWGEDGRLRLDSEWIVP